MKLLERAIRRSDLPVVYSGEFSPRMKLSVAWPLSVGMSSLGEYADITLNKYVFPDQVGKVLDHVLPAGCKIVETKLIGLQEKALTVQVKEAKWRVTVLNEDGSVAEIQELTLPSGPVKNTRVQDMFAKTAKIERMELVLG
jgi:radical SAM-linked protein